MSARALRRLSNEESGYTLMELLTALVVLGILIAIAVPTYLGMKDRTNQTAAKSNLRNVIPAVIEYGQDNSPLSRDDPDPSISTTDSGFSGISMLSLQQHYDPTIDTAKYQVTGSATSYCVYTWVDAWTAYTVGPSGPIKVKLSSAFTPLTDCS